MNKNQQFDEGEMKLPVFVFKLKVLKKCFKKNNTKHKKQ